MNNKSKSISKSIEFDFLALGGLSILIWLLLLFFGELRSQSQLIENRFVQIPIIFAWLSFLCNFPHFLVSYKIAYTKGSKFIIRNWLQLIFVPVFLIGLYVIAYFNYSLDIQDSFWVKQINNSFIFLHLDYRIGTNALLGTELMLFTIRLMYIFVGWHYAKQVFGCMLITLKKSNITLGKFDRNLLKVTLFAIAIFNYVNVSFVDSYFYNIPIKGLSFGLDFLYQLIYFCMGLIVFFIAKFLYMNWDQVRKDFPVLPTVIFFSYIVWWLPPVRQLEFTMWGVPFFHSLQYLVFVQKVEGIGKMSSGKMMLYIFFLVLFGILSFELIPNFLDEKLQTYSGLGTFFFFIALPVFINIHHFFIDNCIWRMDNKDVREKIFSEV